MCKQPSNFLWHSRPRWLYGLVAFVLTIVISFSYPHSSYGFSWLELILRGAQILQLSNLSEGQEIRIGSQINQQLVRQRKIRLLKNPELNSYINAIGQRLAKTSNRPNLPYQFQIVSNRSINAFATMGGFVYLQTGLLLAADNEAELASVIAHEIGHIAGRHAVNQMRDVAISQGLLSAAGLQESTIVQLGVQLAVNLPSSREAEIEADRMGLQNLRRAGYAEIGAIGFMEKLLKQGNSTPSILSTHPATAERLVILEEEIEIETATVGDGLDDETYQNQIRNLL